MSDKVEFATPAGTIVSMEIITERAMVADHTMTERCWDMEVRFGGKPVFAKRIEHDRGPALSAILDGKDGKTIQAIALIPADKVDAVDALRARYVAGAIRKPESDAMRAHRRLVSDMDRAGSNN